jgi:hypothetical protein
MSRRIVRYAVLTALAIPAARAQGEPAVSSPVLTYPAAKKFPAVWQVVEAFNHLGSQAVQLRSAMRPSDAEAFDAVMLDIMGALAAIPEIGVRDSSSPDRIKPLRSRPDRVDQLRPDLAALGNFFRRLRDESSRSADRKLFGSAEKQAQKMLGALPDIMPTVAAHGPPNP